MSDRPIADMAEVNPALRTLPNDAVQVAFVAMTNVRESGGIAETQQVPFGAVKNGFTRFQNGDVLFAKITPCMENGKGALVTGLPGGVGCGSTEFHVLRAKSGNATAYVYHLLQSKAVRQKAEDFMSGSAGQQRVPSGYFARCRVYAPPYETQMKIAAILTSIDTAIEKTEALIEKYRQIKVGLMHDLFTRGALPNGQLRPPREQAPELYQETAIGWIPKEWQLVRMIDLAEERSGSTTIGPFGSDLVATDYRLEGTPVVFVRDVKETGFEWNSDTYVSEKKALQLSAHAVKSGDVLATKMGLPPCVSCLYPSWMPNGVITADMIRLSPDKRKVDGYWLVAAINSDRVKRQVAAFTAGVTRPKVTLGDFRGIGLAKPELSEQQLVSAKLRTMQKEIDTEIARVNKLQLQKHGLMQDLLTGKVPVKVGAGETAHG